MSTEDKHADSLEIKDPKLRSAFEFLESNGPMSVFPVTDVDEEDIRFRSAIEGLIATFEARLEDPNHDNCKSCWMRLRECYNVLWYINMYGRAYALEHGFDPSTTAILEETCPPNAKAQ